MYPTNPPLWERVSPAQLRQELAALAAGAAESAGILQTLSREDSREALRELTAAQARTARCLGGLLFLSGGESPAPAPIAVGNRRQAWAACYRRSLEHDRQFAARTGDGVHGAVFAQLANREAQCLCAILELLGTI